MILADATHEDLTNYHLKMEAMRAQERGDGFSVWHGRDSFTSEDVELLINLEDHTGYLALGKRSIFPGRFVEDGEMVTMVFADTTKGQVTIDLDAEDLAMNPHRVGIDYAPGEDPKLHFYDKLTGDTILETGGDQLHELVDTRVLDPKDYPTTGLAYATTLGLV